MKRFFIEYRFVAICCALCMIAGLFGCAKDSEISEDSLALQTNEYFECSSFDETTTSEVTTEETTEETTTEEETMTEEETTEETTKVTTKETTTEETMVVTTTEEVTTTVAETTTYTKPEISRDQYIITQYGDWSGRQHMFYTIEDYDGNLIVIDGGWSYEADVVRSVIAEHDNHVSAWIITHPHPDHAGAFNVIYQDLQGIVVDTIYTVDVNYDRYAETATASDQYFVCETFRSVISGLNNVAVVHENDEFSVLGLDFKVLHAWDENVDALSSALCNNGSMVFTVTGSVNKMLFLADVQDEMEDFILANHLADLDVDFVQLAHHGNWAVSQSFYDNVSASAVFFDAPGWLFSGSIYTAAALKEYFEGRDVDIYTFYTERNSVVFE